MINFISNLPREVRSGGFSAMNAAAAVALAKMDELHYVGPIDPPFVWTEKATSKLRRSMGLRGGFSFFSERRLRAIAALVQARRSTHATLDYFHGFTPWIRTPIERPYVASGDCTFRDYISIYHRVEQFDRRDVERIVEAEARWLRGAERVLFNCEWAAGRAVGDYGLEAARVVSVGSFGEIEAPAVDQYDGGKAFVFVSTNFEAKGGPAVLDAFARVRQVDPDASLVIVGDAPRRTAAGISFAGYLRKESPSERERLRSMLAKARAIVHPTLSDVAPLILVEAAYFGCPAISSRRFAIPELVDDERTGILLDDPLDVEALTKSMLRMLGEGAPYADMRRNAWMKSRANHSKQRFEARLQQIVAGVSRAREI